jgi:hypothetical protein
LWPEASLLIYNTSTAVAVGGYGIHAKLLFDRAIREGDRISALETRDAIMVPPNTSKCVMREF